jgi:RNA polymerase sigma-70 factor (ECF subfamily)
MDSSRHSRPMLPRDADSPMLDPESSLSSLFEQEVRAIFGYFLVRTGSRDSAEDLTAETFTAATRRFAEGRGSEVSPAWLRTVAHRRLIDFWRAETAHGRRVEAIAQKRPFPQHANDDGRVDEALGVLPTRQRAALVLRYMDGFSTAEVAELLDSTYKATESLLGRARAAFTTAYEEVET